MIIDFHTHVFPEKIAHATINLLSKKGNISPYSDGTLDGLKKSMIKNEIDYSVLLPVVTKPHQFESVNHFAASVNKKNGIFSFGGIHPDNENIEAKLDFIKELGLCGVKIHPDYQETFFDDERYCRIISHCVKIGLYVVTHAGLDVGYPDLVRCTPSRILNLLNCLPKHEEPRLILAHAGSFDMWGEVEEMIAGKNVYLDLAYCLDKIDQAQLVRLINQHGSDKILFATDSPWADQGEYKQLFEKLPISKEDKENIAFNNAAKILGLQGTSSL